MKTKLDLLRAAVQAKHNYWDALGDLEKALVGDNPTDRQSDAIEAEVSILAASFGPGGQAQDMDVARLERTVPAGAPPTPLSYDQFVQAYSECMTGSGNSFIQACVDASWRSYQQDPTGHFMSMTKPETQRAPKFAVGQMVYVSMPAPDGFGVNGRWDWTGKVERISSTKVTGASEYEYLVSDAPIKGSGEFPSLAWESDLKPVFAPDGTMLDRKGNRSVFDDVDK